MSAGRTQQTANMKCATKPGGMPRKRRLKWLGSGSVLAAAIAVAAAVSSPLAAQSVPSMPSAGGGALNNAGPALPGNPILGIKGGPEHVAPMRASVQSVPAPIATKPYIDAKGITLDAPRLPASPPKVTTAQPDLRVELPDANIAFARGGNGATLPNATPEIRPELPDAHAPHGSQRTGSSGSANVPVAAVQAPASSTPAPSPGDTDTNGINVLASANYFASEVDYRPGVASDVVELLGSEAIINWTTFTAGSAGTEVTFLGAGSSLEFTSALTDYTVLNRIFTPGIDSAIRIDGSVTSTVAGGVTGGNVWFYSPGGIVIGSTGSFDVGSLVLTSSALNAINDGDLVFSGVAEPNTSVVIENGATINATNQGSYVAILAPRVEQGGTVNVNGSVAYVGAEQAQLTINNGLFDITVGVGTADANGVVHTGTTTGAASQASVDPMSGAVLNADAQAIYMVSVAKNDAINMLVGGDIGYQAASAASVTDNGTIILSAGANVSVEGGFNSPTIAIDTDNATAGGNVSLTDATLTSDTEVYASGTADLTQSGVNTGITRYNRLTMGGDGRGDYSLDVSAGEAINIGVANFGVIDIAGDITLSGSGDAENPTDISVNVASPDKQPPIGDQIVPIPADAGSFSVGGNLTIDTSARGNDDFFTVRNNGNTGIGQDAVAGDVTVSVSGSGQLTVGGNVTLDASAQGGKGESQNGTATGGNVTFSNLGGTVDITGSLSLDSRAIRSSDGKIGGNGPGLLGANSTAGDISVVLDGDIGTGGSNIGSLALNASAAASSGSDDTTAQTNIGTAGDVSISVLGGTHNLGSLDINAQARGASSYSADGTLTGGGAVLGGLNLSVSGERSLLNVAGDVSIDASSSGELLAGTPSALNISLTGTNFDLLGPIQSGGLVIGDDFFIDLQVSDASSSTVNVARSVNLLVDDSNLSVDTLSISTEASPSGFAFGTAGSGKDFQAGDITVTARNGAEISGRSMFLTASATGNDVLGGNGTGGDISVIADNATIAFTGTTSVNASGQGGASQDATGANPAGTGRGGSVRFQVTGTDGSLDLNTVRARADGSVFLDVEGGGGGFSSGDGGDGIAGDVTFDIDGGVLTAGNVTVSASGEGGEGGGFVAPVAPLSGSPLSGDPSLFADPDAGIRAFAGPLVPISPAPMTLGTPSGLPKGGKGGDGIGGDVTFNLNGGSATMSNLTVSANGEGGEGAFGSLSLGFTGGDGGDATGGTATFNAVSGSLTVTNTLTVSANANTNNAFAFGNGNGGNGSGVEGGNAGSATAGDAVFNLNGTAIIAVADVVVSADAFGGRGGDSSATFFGGVPTNAEAAGAGGNATAGDAVFNNTAGTLTFTSLTVSANGTGGEGGGNFGLSTGESDDVGGAGGSGIGGNATINLNQDDTGSAVYIIEAIGTGGAGGGGLDSGAGGLGQGGTARLNVNDVAVNLGSVTLSATATGGNAGFVDGEGGNGGAGGNAVGGTTIVDVNGVNAVLTSDNAFRTDVSAQGGAGADGNSPIFGGIEPGAGGAGGDGTAGLIQIIARDGANATYQTDSSTVAVGRGGDGGDGGSDFTGPGTADGGAAGTASGGRIEILAQTGATLNMTPLSTSVDLDVSAFGANGGNAGTNSFGGVGLVGANGDASAGSILVSADGTGTVLSFIGDLNATANATATTDLRTGAIGGNATGGDFEVTVANGATLVANAGLGLRSTATGGTASGAAGDATGANATITLAGGTLLGSAIAVDLQTLGGTARPNNSGAGGNGADGGTATGGTISVSVDDNSDLSVASLFLTTNALGGNGGQAGFAGGTSGGAGGAATGSDITVDLQGDATGLGFVQMVSSASGGAGGAGRNGAAGGQGGTALGGDLVFDINGTGPTLAGLASVNLLADAAGGAGGAGGEGDDLIASGSGGGGGAATGGSATFALSGNGATLAFNPATFVLSTSGTGGSGGAGGNNGSGGATGTGGAGGAGTGGTTTLQANAGTTLDLSGGGTFTLSSNGQGGNGGIGGDAFLSGGAGGNGGAGGTGRGGSPTLRANGGTIIGGDLQLTATGVGGNGGSGGDDGNATFGATGQGGNGEGGTPVLEIQNTSPTDFGSMTFQNVDLLANGTAGTGGAGGQALGGRVEIYDLSQGDFSFASLDVDASGDGAIFGGGLIVDGSDGSINITGNLGVNVAGDIRFNFVQDGQAVVGGNVTLDADGDITITHGQGAVPVNSFDVTGTFGAQAGGNFTSGAGSLIVAGGSADIRAEGNVSVDDITGVGVVDISAAQNVTVNNASVSGTPVTVVLGAGTLVAGPQLIVQAGVNSTGTAFDPNFNALITGDLSSTGEIGINAGGTVTFQNGSNTVSDNGLRVATGDDIIIESGASLVAGANPATTPSAANPFSSFNNLVLDAGGLDPLVSATLTPIASIVSNGTINANDFAIVMSANAIDATGGIVTASSIAADIVDAPTNLEISLFGRSDDAGLLSAGCLQGAVCLGNVVTDNQLLIGQASNNNVIDLFIGQGTVNANDVVITTRSGLAMGTGGVATVLAAADQFSLTSLEGDIDLRDTVITSDSIAISAAGSLLGTASLTSANNIGIDVGADLNATLIDTGGGLTTVGGFAGVQYTVPGSISVGTLNQGNSAVNIVADGSINIGTVNIDGLRDITLSAGNGVAGGDVFLGTATGARNIDLRGDNVGFDNLNASQFIDLITAGDITGGNLASGSLMTLRGDAINVGNLTPGFILNVTSTGGDIEVGNIVSSSSVTINSAASLTASDITAGGLGANLTAAGNVSLGNLATTAGVGDISVNAGGAFDFTAISGLRVLRVIAGDVTGGDVSNLTGNVDIEGTSIDIGNVTANGGFAILETTVGDLVAESVSSTTFGVQLTSAANVQTGDLDGRGIIVSAPGDVTVGDALSSTNLSMTVGGNLTSGQLEALSTSPGMTVNVTGDAAIAGANSNGLLTLNVGGELTGGDFSGASLTRVTAESVDIDSVQSRDQSLTVTATGGNAVIDTVSSRFASNVTATGDVIVGDMTTGTSSTLRGANVTLNSGDITGNLTLDATAGNISGTGTINVSAGINLDATGNIGFGTLNAQGGAFTADAGGNISFDSATASTTLTMNAVGDISFNALGSGNATRLDAGGSIFGGAVDTAGTGDTTFIAGTAVELDDIVARILTVTAGTDLTIGNVDAIGRDIRGIAIDLNAGGTATFGDLISGRGIDVDATSISGGNVTSDNGVNFAAENVTLGNVAVTESGSAVLDATNGALAVGNVTSTTFGIDLSASADLTAGNLLVNGTANASDISVDAGGNATIGDATAGNQLAINVGGNLTAGNLSSNVVSPGTVITVTGDADIAFFDATAGTALLDIGGALTGGDFAASSVLTIEADSINIGSAISDNQTVSITANALDITVGTIDSALGTTLTAVRNITVDHADAGTDFTATGGGDFATSLNSIITGGDIVINMGGAVDLGNSTAGGLIDVQGTQIDFASLTAGTTVDLTTAGAIGGGDIDADGDVTLDASTMVLGDVTTLTNVTANATGGDATFGSIDAGNNITIVASGVPTISSINVGNNLSITGSSVTLGAGNIAGQLLLQATAGDVLLSLDGAEQITVGGPVQISASNDIVVTHTNNAGGVISLDSASNISFAATGAIDVQAGSILSGNEVFLLASGQINVDDVRAIPGMIIQGGGSVFVNNATATGPQGLSNFRGITIEAGLDPFGGSVFDNFANVTITGAVDSYADITVRAGGQAIFATGSGTVANDRIFVQTGDDIIVQAGATLTSARAPSAAPDPMDPFNGTGAIELQAGGLTNLLSVPATPIASLVVDGTLDANGSAIIASANAIDGLDGTFDASSIQLDINDAPSVGGSQSDDAGLLSADCVEGNICLGNILADNVVSIGQNSNNDVIQLIVEQGSVNANDILITTRNDIVMGSNGIATTLNAANTFSATSISGDVNLFDANITSNQILINAAGSLLGSAVLDSTNDIGITVGQNLTAASITTGGELTQVASVGGALEGFYSVNGSIDIGTLSVGAGNVNLSANNDIVIDSIIVPGTDISLAAGGLAELGFTNTATNVSLDGNAVIFGTIDASGDVGADSGSTIDITSITAGNNIDLLAVDAVTGGDLTATGSLTVEGGLIAINNGTANQIDIFSDTDILFNLLQSTNDLILTANNGSIANNGGAGDIQSGGGVDLTALEIAIGNVTANGDVGATSTNGSLVVGAITNNAFGSSINLSAAGTTSDVTTGDLRTNEGDIFVSAARDITLAGAATSIGTPIGGNIGLLAGRDIAVAGNLSAGEDVSIRALGAATLTDIIAGDDVVINAVGAVNLVSATTFDTGMDDAGLTFVDANAGQPGSIGFGTENLPGSNIDIRSDAGVTVTGTLDSSGNIDVIGAGDVIVQEAISVGGTFLNGANVTLVDGAITGGLAIDATLGTIDVTGDVSVGGTITFDAATDVTFGDLRSDNGEFDIVAGGNITFGNAGAADNLAFDAGGAITGGNLDSGNFLTLEGGDIAVANVTGPFVGMVSASDILFGTINATNRVELTATNGSVAANMGAANITSGGDIVVIANAIDVGDLTAAGVLSLDGGSVALGAGNADSIDITSGSDILFNSLVSPNAITLNALNGRIGTNGGSGDIDSDDDVDLTAQEIAIGDVAAGGSVTASATDGNATLGNITATSNVTVTATGTAVVADVTSGGDTFITGTTVGLGTGTVGGDLSLTATAGDLTGIGAVTVAGGIALSASGDIGFGSLEAQGGAFTVDAGGDIIFDTLTSADLARLDAGGLIDGNRIDADTAITLTANSSIDIDHAEAGTDFTATAGGNFTTGLNSIITGGDIVVAGDIVNLGNSTAGGLIQVTGTQIDFVNLVAGSTIDLLTDFNTPQGGTGSGNLNITGVNITAGTGASSLDSLGNITITGDTIIGGSLTMGADGDITFVTADVQGGDFEATADGDIAFASAVADGAVDFLAGGSIAGSGDVEAGTSVDLVADAGSVAANDIRAGGDVNIGAGTTVSINDIFGDANDLAISAGGDVGLRDTLGTVNVAINSGGTITYRDIDAGLVADLDAVSDITGTSITAGDVIDVRSSGGGAVTADDFSSNRNVSVITTGQVTVANVAAALGGTGDATITGDAGIDIDTLSAIAATLNSANGSIIVDGNAAIQNLLTANGVDVFLRSDTDMQVLTEATGGTIDIAVDGNLDVQGATAAGDITLVSGGFTAINAPVGGNASTPPGFQGTQQVTTTNGGNVSITAGTDIVINSTVSAAGNLTMDAGGLIDIQATASGVQIDTLSVDMNIGTAGALGRSDQTNAITIETIGDIQLGGAAGTSTGFEIDADEFTRIFSGGDLSLVATGLTTGEGNITVDDLVVTAATGTGGPTDGNIATFGSLILEADNDVSFLGDFTLTNATADSVFIVDAINQIFIDAEEATVRVEDNAGAISGNIDMSAGSIIAATSALLADLPNLSFADAEAAAGQAAATPRPDGYIFGSEINFAVDSLLLIQNSAAGTDFADRRGITADTLSIFERTPGIGIAINGIVGGNSGLDAIAVTTVPTTFDPLSTINGCLIADPSSCIVVVTPPSPGPTNDRPDNPLSDLIDDQIDPESPVESGSIISMIVEFRDDPERQTDPLIDEPVTGAGNEDLWIGDEEDCDPADASCELEPAE